MQYLGYRIDAQGVHTTVEKVEAIRDAPVPQNTQELKSFLDILHFYDKFMPNLSSLLHPLNQLLRSGIPWEWSPACDQAFTSAKNLLIAALLSSTCPFIQRFHC